MLYWPKQISSWCSIGSFRSIYLFIFGSKENRLEANSLYQFSQSLTHCKSFQYGISQVFSLWEKASGLPLLTYFHIPIQLYYFQDQFPAMPYGFAIAPQIFMKLLQLVSFLSLSIWWFLSELIRCKYSRASDILGPLSTASVGILSLSNEVSLWFCVFTTILIWELALLWWSSFVLLIDTLVCYFQPWVLPYYNCRKVILNHFV